MNRKLLIPFAVFSILAFLTISCKKKNPTDPVNKAAETCSTCVSESLEIEGVYDSTGNIIDTVLVNTSYAQATDFWLYGQNTGIGAFMDATPHGVCGSFGHGASIAFNTSGLMECPANKLTFVHGQTDYAIATYPLALLNVQLPGTPVICTTVDSLAYYLAPYGYTVEKYRHPATIWLGTNPAFNTHPGQVDSIIIRGLALDNFTVGAFLHETELRSICVAHE